MTRKRVLRRVLVGTALTLVLALVVTAVVAVSFAKRPLPTTTGELSLAGLSAPVTVLRGEHGVPQIYASTPTDLARAQGYVHAQDQFFTMDLRRHVTAGRLSELVGSGGLKTDVVLRTLGWRKVAEAELPTLAPQTRQLLQAYADGVNAYLQSRTPSQVSLEYAVLGMSVKGYQIEPWTPADSVSWLKAMAWDLKGNYDTEILRARLSDRLTPAQIDEIFPPYPTASHAPILSAEEWSPAVTTRPLPQASTDPGVAGPPAHAAYTAVAHAISAVPALVGTGEGVGSNSWVVSGARSSTGAPLLANDPHLGISIPGIWYQVGLHCRTVDTACPFDVAGYSFAGMPGVVIGHNRTVAWAMTNLGPDVTDLYLERVKGQTYLRDGAWVPLTVRTETVQVPGRDPVKVTVRSTVHGPILSDAVPTVAEVGERAPVPQGAPPSDEEHYAVSLAWTGLVPSRTMDAIVALDQAKDFASFRSAAALLSGPSQNLLYADSLGHIGYQAPGLIPLRRAARPGAAPGAWPAPGWDSSYDWKGWVPFEDLPWTLDPAKGFLVSANQEVTASPTPFLTSEWDAGYRSQRIRERLEALPKVSPDDMRAIQLDNVDPFAATLLPVLRSVDLHDDPFTREAQSLLLGWDGSTPVGGGTASAAAAYFNATWSNLVRLLYDDELPDDAQADGGDTWRLAATALLAKPRSSWWDDKNTSGVVEGRDEIIRQALVRARLDLTRQLGKDPSSWDWGRLHRLTFEHQVLGGDAVPAPVRALFNRGPYDLPGGSAIVDALGWDAAKGYDVNWGPSMRMVVDLGHLDASTWVNQTGQSGHVWSATYDDQIEDWASGRQYSWAFTEPAVKAAGGDELTLRPAPSGG